MFDRKFIVVVTLSFITMLAFRLIFNDGPKQAVQQTVSLNETDEALNNKAYKLPHLFLPANREVSFVNETKVIEDSRTIVTLPHYTVELSSLGGSIQSLSYVHHTDDANKPLCTIHANAAVEESLFVVALAKNSPISYALSKHETAENGDVTVVYGARSGDWNINKTFVFHATTYQIDVTLEFVPLVSRPETIRPRLFVKAPQLADLARDRSGGVAMNEKQSGLMQVSGVSALEKAWIMPQFFGVEDNYFAHVLLDDDRAFAQRAYFKQDAATQMTAIYEGPEVAESVVFPLSFYVGPKSLPALRAIHPQLEDLLSFGWLSYLAKLLLQLLQWLHIYVENYGIAIILLTLLLKLVLLPFSLKSASYMAAQQKLNPRLTALRKKYAHDPQMLYAEQAKLYKEHNVSMASQMLGCLLGLPQVPLFFALYRVLGNSIELYQAPFLGWITDLSVKDPYYILPIIAGLLAFSQPFGMQQQKESFTAYIFPVILLAMFVSFPAGMLLFVIVNFLMSVGEKAIQKVM